GRGITQPPFATPSAGNMGSSPDFPLLGSGLGVCVLSGAVGLLAQPLPALRQCAGSERLPFGDGLFLAAQALALALRGLHGWEQAEIDVHRLEGAFSGFVLGNDVPAGDVIEQGAES